MCHLLTRFIKVALVFFISLQMSFPAQAFMSPCQRGMDQLIREDQLVKEALDPALRRLENQPIERSTELDHLVEKVERDIERERPARIYIRLIERLQKRSAYYKRARGGAEYRIQEKTRLKLEQLKKFIVSGHRKGASSLIETEYKATLFALWNVVSISGKLKALEKARISEGQEKKTEIEKELEKELKKQVKTFGRYFVEYTEVTMMLRRLLEAEKLEDLNKDWTAAMEEVYLASNRHMEEGLGNELRPEHLKDAQDTARNILLHASLGRMEIGKAHSLFSLEAETTTPRMEKLLEYFQQIAPGISGAELANVSMEILRIASSVYDSPLGAKRYHLQRLARSELMARWGNIAIEAPLLGGFGRILALLPATQKAVVGQIISWIQNTHARRFHLSKIILLMDTGNSPEAQFLLFKEMASGDPSMPVTMARLVGAERDWHNIKRLAQNTKGEVIDWSKKVEEWETKAKDLDALPIHDFKGSGFFIARILGIVMTAAVVNYLIQKGTDQIDEEKLEKLREAIFNQVDESVKEELETMSEDEINALVQSLHLDAESN